MSYLEDNGYEVVETDVNTLDITNIEQVKTVLNKEKPDIVVHCAHIQMLIRLKKT